MRNYTLEEPLGVSVFVGVRVIAGRALQSARRSLAPILLACVCLGVFPAQGQTPSPVGVTPTNGSALTQTFTFSFSDLNGWQDLGVVNVLINNSLDGRQACISRQYVRSSNALFLVDDAGDAGGPFVGALTLDGSAGSIANSQCQVNGTGSLASGSVNTLTLKLNMTFLAPLRRRPDYVHGGG